MNNQWPHRQALLDEQCKICVQSCVSSWTEYYGWSKPRAETGGAAACQGEEIWLPAAGHWDKCSSWSSSGLQRGHRFLGNSQIIDREQCWYDVGKICRAKAMFPTTKEQNKGESRWGRRKGTSSCEKALLQFRPKLCTGQLQGASSSDGMSGQQEGWERETRKGGRDRREPGWEAKPFSNLVEMPDKRRDKLYPTIGGETAPWKVQLCVRQTLGKNSLCPEFHRWDGIWWQISPCNLWEDIGIKVCYSVWKETAEVKENI